MKKITQKLFVLLVAVLMVVATGVGRVHAETKSTDVGTLTVNGLDKSVIDGKGEEVTFYKIAAVTYNGDNPNLAADWTYANPTVKDKILALLGQPDGERDYEQFINEMAQGILGNTNTITPIGEPKVLRDSDHNGTIKWETTYRDATAEDVTNGLAENVGDPVSNNDGPKPGIYIARVTDAEGAKIYNPALLTVLYDSENLQIGVVDLAKAYNNSATLKSSEPGSDKAIKGNNNDDQNRVVYDDTKPSAIGPKGTNAKDEYDEDNDEWETVSNDNNLGAKTVSVGDKIDYEAEIAIPEYPKNAKDQTIWFNDVMGKGLTFDSQYFTMKLTGTSYSVNVDIAAGTGDRNLSVTKSGTFYEASDTADPAYYKGTDGNYYLKSATLPEGVTIDTTGTKYAQLSQKTFTFGKIKFNEGAPNGGFVAVVTDYETLRELLALDNKIPSQIKIRLDYSAILNEHAVVGQDGNKNKITYVYSNEPSQGNTHKTTDEAKDRKRQEDEEIVYTYEVSVLKTDVKVENPFKTIYTEVDTTDFVAGETSVVGFYTRTGTDPDYTYTEATGTFVTGQAYYAKSEVIKTEDELIAEYPGLVSGKVFLPDAEFDVYDGDKKTGGKLIGHVVTNDKGIATLSDVAKGTYYFYETKAPAGGYSFDPNEAHKVEATWTSCTWTNSYSDEEIRYTSEKDKAVNTTQVGWIKGGKYYEMTAFNYYVDETDGKVYADNTKAEEISGVLPAYIKSHTTSSSSTTQTLTNPQKAGGGVAVLQVKNSKNPTLPSTGGIGTYLFTIAGVAIIATAAFMLIFRKKEGHTH